MSFPRRVFGLSLGAAFAMLALAQERLAMTTTQPAASRPPNRLGQASSPYLQQHARNPVDWYEWGDEALERARRENKPIFLSIGYSACHWCHVMAHESFEDEPTAAVMNRYFINIKVDREERPDLDDIYMQATILYSRSGGWPMSVWLTPQLKPFAAGTYFPPTARWGRPGFRDVCANIGQLWETRRGEIEQDAERIAAALAEQLAGAGSVGELTLPLIDQAADQRAGAFDGARGGLSGGGTNKFPPSMAMDLMLRVAHRNRERDPRAADRLVSLVRLTLDQMAAGGIYDQLAGGIHRYSTDVDWLVPHFEKMLYDQALVSRIYLDAFQYTRDPRYARIAREICDYVLADLQSPAGGFYSARDADSEGVEGRYFVWTRGEILAALGPAEGPLFCDYYGVTEAGNWQDPHAPDEVKNILHVPKELASFAQFVQIDPTALDARLAASRQKLLAARSRRVPPHRDEKILCEWNGLMIASLARASTVLSEPRYRDAARRAATFIFAHQWRGGRLLRSYRDGRLLEAAFVTDYAALIDACLELHEATFERVWLERALALNAVLTEQHWDTANGGYFFTAHDHERLIARAKDARDNALPSGNSLQLANLVRLAVITGDARLREMADRLLNAFAGEAARSLGLAERFLCSAELALAGPVELAIVGDPTDARTQALLRVAYDHYLPNRVILLLNPASPEAGVPSPLLTDRGLVDGQPAAYVCRSYACQRPVTTPADLAGLLIK